MVYRAYQDPSTFQPVMSFRMVARRAYDCWCSLHVFLEHVEGESLEVAFVGQVGEGSQIAFENDRGEHACRIRG